MIRSVDTDEILTELQALAQDSTGPATVAILACMDVVERHAKIVDEHEIAARLQVEPVPSLIVQHQDVDGRREIHARKVVPPVPRVTYELTAADERQVGPWPGDREKLLARRQREAEERLKLGLDPHPGDRREP